MTDEGWIVVYTGNIVEVDFLKSMLAGSGIESMLQNEAIGMIAPDTAGATQASTSVTDSTATSAATAQDALQPGPCRHGRNYYVPFRTMSRTFHQPQYFA